MNVRTSTARLTLRRKVHLRRTQRPIPLAELLPQALEHFRRQQLAHGEAAEYLRISPRTLDSLVQRGEIHPARAGRRKRLYAVETLDAYLRTTARRAAKRR